MAETGANSPEAQVRADAGGHKRDDGIARWAVLVKWGSPVLLIAAWQIAATINGSLLVPTPAQVAVSLGQQAFSSQLWVDLWRSNQALLLGASTALVLGVLIGVLLGRSTTLNKIFGVYIDAALVVPAIAILPLVIILFGLGLFARSFVVFWFAFALVASIVRTGARTVDEGLIEMGTAFAPTTLQLWTKVVLPGLLPALGAAVRIAIARGVVGMVIVELILTGVGIGGLIMNAKASFHASNLYADVIVVCLEAVLLMAVGRWAERKIAPHGLYGTD